MSAAAPGFGRQGEAGGPAPQRAVEALRAQLWDEGFRPVAVFSHDRPDRARAGKAPLGVGWDERARRDPPEAAVVSAVAHAMNTGILCDGLRGVDVDIDEPELAGRARALAVEFLGETISRGRENSPRFLLPYRAAEGAPRKRTLPGRLGKVEVLGQGQQFVSHGTHESGAPLHWSPEAPEECGRDALPVVTEEQVTRFLRAVAPLIEADPAQAEDPARGPGRERRAGVGTGPASADTLDVIAALAAIPNDGPADWEHWNNVGMAAWAATGGDEHAFAAWCAWSARHPEHDAAACRARWEHYFTSPPTQTGAGKLYALAHEAVPGWRRPSETRAEARRRRASEPPRGEDAKGPAAGPKADGTALTEDGVARTFAERFGDRLRYDHHSGKWYHWDGTRWRREETRLALDWARATCRDLARDADASPRVAAAMARANTASAVERFARADRAFAVTSEVWDRDPWLLGTPGGTVDLRTGELRPAHKEDFITKATAVTPAGTADCPLWLQFLDEATGGDQGVVRFLRRWFGYTLTGDTSEHALLFVYGPGGNGKSVLTNTASHILGDYCRTAPMEAFTASNGDRHSTELAMLQGARMVCASETEEGRAWAEARIKQLTGGDRIAARFMRQDFFEFTPRFKLTIAGNNKPVLRNVDDAARRRINMLPFVHKPAAPDRGLEQRLRGEWPGILRWMIDGCLHWQGDGLVRPRVVVEATDEYFLEQDSFRQWVEDCCVTSAKPPHVRDTHKSLFASWRAFASGRGEEAGSSKRFSAALRRLYCTPIKDAEGILGRGWRGIRVRLNEPGGEPS